MPQSNFIVDGNQSRTQVGIDIQAGLVAAATLSSGPTPPVTTYAYQLWVDTTTNLLKQRNASNTAWFIIGPLFKSIVTPALNNFRLSGVSGEVSADTAGTSNLFLTPYNGNKLALYDNTSATWREYTLNEQTIPLACVANTNYDIFALDNGSGVVVFEQVAWTNNTTRANALSRQDGVWVRSGSPEKRYLGTYRGTGVNTTVSTNTRRFIFNAENRIPHRLGWNLAAQYTITTNGVWRVLGGLTSNYIEVVAGLADQDIDLKGTVLAECGPGNSHAFGWGVRNTILPPTAGTFVGSLGYVFVERFASTVFSMIDRPPVGYHFYAPLESTVTSVNVNRVYAQYTGVHSTWNC